MITCTVQPNTAEMYSIASSIYIVDAAGQVANHDPLVDILGRVERHSSSSCDPHKIWNTDTVPWCDIHNKWSGTLSPIIFVGLVGL